jgi:hypothetical protein
MQISEEKLKQATGGLIIQAMILPPTPFEPVRRFYVYA